MHSPAFSRLGTMVTGHCRFKKDQARILLIKVWLKPATSGHSSTVTGGDQFPLRTPHPKKEA
jgi:hypothetical protein